MGGYGGEGLVVCGDAELVGFEGVFEGVVVVLEREVGLREVVVCFHVVGGEAEALVAVVEDAVPVVHLESGHGAVGVEGGVGWVGDEAGGLGDEYGFVLEGLRSFKE